MSKNINYPAEFSESLRRFLLLFFSGSILSCLKSNIKHLDYKSILQQAVGEEQTAILLFINNLQYDKDGKTLNYHYCVERSAKYIAMKCAAIEKIDLDFNLPKFESWEFE